MERRNRGTPCGQSKTHKTRGYAEEGKLGRGSLVGLRRDAIARIADPAPIPDGHAHQSRSSLMPALRSDLTTAALATSRRIEKCPPDLHGEDDWADEDKKKQ